MVLVSKLWGAIREVAAAVDTANAMRHGTPVSEDARRRCAHREPDYHSLLGD